ncbi:MAG: restriction endonuclease subunit S [Chloroflexota bacterium]|nr:restriction endonuclease subunit S [Chloroflexota bacterium]MDE2883564.1 restriction endonuclease subunit S [Chloroflexota bacterium]
MDVRPDHLAIVQGVLREHLPAGVKVWVFGSRANWTTKDSSDLDLAIEGEGKLSHHVLGALRDAFEDSTLPYTVDVVDLNRVGESFRQIVESQQVPLPLDGDEAEHQIRSAASPTASVFTDTASRTGSQNQWRRVALGDLVDLRLSSVDKKSRLNEQAVQLCNYMDVYDNSFIQADMDFMPATATEREIARCSLAAGDVVITKDSEKHDDIGVPAFVRENIPNLVCGYHLAILRPQTSVVDGTYLFYALRADEAQEQFHSYANGITRFGLRKSDIGLVEVPLPPLPEQRAVAHVLGTLDDKIELNRRMNKTLEEIARVLFRSWFVDFDPVREKMEGRDTGLPSDLAALFPDRLVPSKRGDIPEGWELKMLGEMAHLNPESWSKTKYPASIEYVDLANTKWGMIQSTQHFSWENAPSRARRVLRPGDTIVGTVRPGNGSYSFIGQGGLTASTGFAVLRPSHPHFRELIYLSATAFDNIEWLAHRADGAAYPAVRPEVLSETEVAIPVADTGVLTWFSETVGTLLDKIESVKAESRALSVQRDVLLPGLVSGEVRFNNQSEDIVDAIARK